jgi:hypothetical protein
MTVVFSLAGRALVVSAGIAPLLIRQRHRAALIVCSLLFGVGWVTAAARTRLHAPLKFEIKVVDSVTGKPKAKYFLGETISVVFTVTNQGRRPQIISILLDTTITYVLASTSENKEPETFESYHGGTGGSYVDPPGNVFWTSREPSKMTLAPGESSSVRIDDLRVLYDTRLAEGKYRLTATYPERLKATISFQVVFDKAKSIPLLEKIAAGSAATDEHDKLWAKGELVEIRQPSLGGLVTDTDGKPLKDARISVTGPENGTYDARSNGRYSVWQGTPGGTYTLTPFLTSDGSFDMKYTFEPASRTVTNQNAKLRDLNFKGTRIRPSTNVAEDSEGAIARASSTHTDPADMFEPNNVIDGNNSGQWDQCCNGAWVDATPNAYPDWIEVSFKGPRAIDWINVFSPQDHPETSPDPILTETFTKEGITDFDVQYWNGRVWKNVPGGAIRGNRNVWRKIAFPTLTTNKIRVVVRKALTSYSKIMEIEAFHINEVPLVKLAGTSKGRTGSSFQFHTRATDKDRAISQYTFGYGDGTPNYELNYGNNPAVRELNLIHTHKYDKPGTYNVTLRVMDHDDEGSETAMKVTVIGPPVPVFANSATVHQGVVGKAMFLDGRRKQKCSAACDSGGMLACCFFRLIDAEPHGA